MYLVIVTVRLQAPLRENIFGCVQWVHGGRGSIWNAIEVKIRRFCLAVILDRRKAIIATNDIVAIRSIAFSRRSNAIVVQSTSIEIT